MKSFFKYLNDTSFSILIYTSIVLLIRIAEQSSANKSPNWVFAALAIVCFIYANTREPYEKPKHS